MNLFSYELTRLVDDYFKCDCPKLKAQIREDIQLLTDAFIQTEENKQLI